MVKNLFTLLNSRQNNILSGAAILMVAVFGSKVLALIRDRLLAHYFDTGQIDIFFGAFRLPDLMFQLIIFGALSVAFIPVFTDHLNKQGEESASEFASNILNLSLVVFGIVCILAFIFTPQLNSFFVPGFSEEKKMLTNYLTRILLFSQFLLVIGSFFVGISQSYQRFLIPALAPLLYNIGTILGIVFLSGHFGISGPAFGTVLGAFLHVIIQLPLIKSLGFRYKFTLNFFDKGVRDIFKMMSIRNIGLVAEQINETVALALASLGSGSLTMFTFAQHLQTAPIGLFGATLAQAALPVLSREHSKSEGESFKITLLTTMHQILFLTLPAAAILIVLRIPAVRLVFGASKFGWEDTVLTGRTVAFLALGLAAQSVMLLLIRGFYALKDTKTPVLVSISSVVLNISLSYIFISVLRLDVWALGLAYAITNNLSLILLLYFLNKKVGGFDINSLAEPALKMLLAAVIAAIALYIPIKALDQLVFDTTKTINLLILTGIASLFGLSIYLLLVWLLQVRELSTFVNLLKRTVNFRSGVKSEEIIKESGV